MPFLASVAFYHQNLSVFNQTQFLVHLRYDADELDITVSRQKTIISEHFCFRYNGL